MAVNNGYRDEVNLIDLVNIFFRYKWVFFIAFIICASLGVIYNLIVPSIYSVETVIDLPRLGIGEYLDTSQNISDRIRSGIYDLKIREKLELPNQEPFSFNVELPKQGKFCKVRLDATGNNIDLTKDILTELVNQLEQEYRPIIEFKKQEIDFTVALKESLIKKKEDKISALHGKIKLFDDNLSALSETIALAEKNTKELIDERRKFIATEREGTSIASVLYSTTIQQDIAYFNQLNKELNFLKIEKDNAEDAIILLSKEMEDINLDINNLKIKKGLIANIDYLVVPMQSFKPILPRRMLNLVIALLVGVCFGVGLVFFCHWYNMFKKGQNNY